MRIVSWILFVALGSLSACTSVGPDPAPAVVHKKTLHPWLFRHQSSDGSWKSHDYTDACVTTCRSLNPENPDGRGEPGYDVGVTALSMLTFAGEGHTHRAGEYPEYIYLLRKAVNYLVSVQVSSDDPAIDGRYGSDGAEHWLLNHALATLAMAELLAMSGDDAGLKDSVTRATELCLRAQRTGQGWSLDEHSSTSDFLLTGWMLLAVKTAKACRLDVEEQSFETCFAGVLAWLNSPDSVADQPRDRAIEIVCRFLCGQKRSHERIELASETLLHSPAVSRGGGTDLMHLYFASTAMLYYGGERAREWDATKNDAILSALRVGGDEDGSWDPADRWGKLLGRVGATAIVHLVLEHSYRWPRIR